MHEVSDSQREKILAVSQMIYSDRGERKAEFNQKAEGTIKLMREALPDLSDETIYIIFSSVAVMLQSIMVTPLVKVGTSVAELFDIYTLAASSLAGVIDLHDESPAPTPAELEREALIKEIAQLREALSQPGGDDYRPGNYL